MSHPVDVEVVVTCTDRKTVSPEQGLMLRSVPREEAAARVATWLKRLATVPAKLTPAADLYTGNAWHVVRSIATAGTSLGAGVRIWIASAGWGLIPFDAPLKSYSATFASGQDSIGNNADSRIWWRALGMAPGPVEGAPRSIAALASRSGDRPVFIAASPGYLRAMQDDIAAASALGRDRLLLISAGTNAPSALHSYLLEADGRFRQALGGQFPSLNSRLLDAALRVWATERDLNAVRRAFAQQRDSLPPFRPSSGSAMSDAEVVAYIQEQRRRQPDAGHTTLLRRLRATGRACEQKRFRNLFMSLGRPQ